MMDLTNIMHSVAGLVGKLIRLAVCMALSTSCTSHADKVTDDNSQPSDSLIGTQLILDETIGHFSTDGRTPDSWLPQTGFTILHYVSREDCIACSMHLTVFPKIIGYLSDVAGTKVGFVCVVDPGEMRELRRVLSRDNLDRLTVWVDDADSLNRLNRFPEEDHLRTFLLDRRHRILSIGDPARDPRDLWEFAQLLGSDSINPALLPLAEISADRATADLGTVALNDTVTTLFTITNTGDNMFVTDRLVTSCDCTTGQLTSDTIAPGQSTVLTVRFSESAQKGEFFRTVSIYGNTPDPLVIELTGIITSKTSAYRTKAH